ncbi:MAG: hypothetical protein KAR42_13540 [candidate division Zixibacteria bacterium]|nr:hypothetical protein [candidate division Zixibacteria bacterium]
MKSNLMGNNKETCEICSADLTYIGGLPFCPNCNDNHGDFYNSLSSTIASFAEDSNMVMIECPGATIYHEGSNDVKAGVKFYNNNDPSKGYEIVTHPVYGPKHVKRRWVKKEDAHLIRRCQSCQDHTIRNRRKEGPDLYIPSRKHDNRHHRKVSHESRQYHPPGPRY